MDRLDVVFRQYGHPMQYLGRLIGVAGLAPIRTIMNQTVRISRLDAREVASEC